LYTCTVGLKQTGTECGLNEVTYVLALISSTNLYIQ